MDMDQHIHIIDRKTKTIVRTIENPSGNDNPLCMHLAPMFDFEKFPYAILRDKNTVSMINLRTSMGYKCILSWYSQLPFP